MLLPLQDQELATAKDQATIKAQEAADLQAAMVSVEEQNKRQVCLALCCCQLSRAHLKYECVVALLHTAH